MSDDTRRDESFQALSAHVLAVIESHAHMTNTPLPAAPGALAASIARSLTPEHMVTWSTPESSRTSEEWHLRVIAEVAR